MNTALFQFNIHALVDLAFALIIRYPDTAHFPRVVNVCHSRRGGGGVVEQIRSRSRAPRGRVGAESHVVQGGCRALEALGVEAPAQAPARTDARGVVVDGVVREAERRSLVVDRAREAVLARSRGGRVAIQRALIEVQ